MKRYRIPIKKAVNWSGRKDARQGRMPILDSSEYRTGYSEQYARDQIQSARTIF